MSTMAEAPVATAADATARIAQLGCEREFEALVEHALETVPGLRRLEVTLEYDPEESRHPTVVLNMYRTAELNDDPTPREWRAWLTTTFPAEVCQHFALVTIYE